MTNDEIIEWITRNADEDDAIEIRYFCGNETPDGSYTPGGYQVCQGDNFGHGSTLAEAFKDLDNGSRF